jgi:nitrogen regulatory protein P-II 1
MKLISSVVRFSKFDEVKQALHSVRVDSLNVTERLDHAPQKHETTVWLGREYSLGFARKMQIDIVVHDDQVDEVVGAIIKAARTGHPGDGHVLVVPLEHRYNIRNGDRDVA